MSDDYWNSPDAAIAMGHVGKQAGLREGFQHGRDQGFHEGAAAMQEAAATLQQQLDQLAHEKGELQELANGLVMIVTASMAALSTATDAQQAAFAKAYIAKSDETIGQGALRVSPHADSRFAARFPTTTRFVRETLEAVLRAHNLPKT